MTEIKVEQKVFFVPDVDSPCDAWRTYFKQLKQSVGTDHARTIWLMTWSRIGETLCATNPEFLKWLKQNQIDISNAAIRAVADVSEISSNVFGLGKNLTKVLSIGIPATLAALLGLVAWLLVRNIKNGNLDDAVATGMQGVTGGRL